jgi:hypothetical protein
MSAPQAKRKLLTRLAVIIVAVVMLYPLSVGPAFWIADRVPGANPGGFGPTMWLIYGPIFRTCEQSAPLYKALCWYACGGLVPRPTHVQPAGLTDPLDE